MARIKNHQRGYHIPRGRRSQPKPGNSAPSNISPPVAHKHLVYEHKCGSLHLVPEGLGVMTDMEVAMILSMNPTIRVVTKTITPKKTAFSVYQVDLEQKIADEGRAQKGASGEAAAMSAKERKAAKTAAKRAAKQDEAAQVEEDGDEVPWSVFMGHEWEGHEWSQVTILFPEHLLH